MKLSDVQKDVLGRMEYSTAKVLGNDVVLGAGNHLKIYIKALEKKRRGNPAFFCFKWFLFFVPTLCDQNLLR